MNKPANDNAPRIAAALPLAIRLARAGREEDLKRLIRHGTVTVVPSWLSADGNLPEAAGKPLADRVTEIRPGEEEIVFLAAQDAIAVRVGCGPITAREMDAPMRARLRFDATGRITKWRGSDERWHNAAELFRQPKGKRRKSEAERQDDNQRHLTLPATGNFPAAPMYHERGSVGEDYRRQRAARWAQILCGCNDNRRIGIDRAGLGSRVAFAQARENAGLAPAERSPVGIAPGAEFLAYRVHSNPTAAKGSFVGAPDAVERQIVETIDVPRTDAALGQHAKILDLSILGKTAREIADEMGWGGTKQAERKAVAAQDAALAALAGMEEKLAA